MENLDNMFANGAPAPFIKYSVGILGLGPVSFISAMGKKSENGQVAVRIFANVQIDTGVMPKVSVELAVPGRNKVQNYSYKYEERNSEYKLGEPTEPVYGFDNGFPYDPCPPFSAVRQQ